MVDRRQEGDWPGRENDLKELLAKGLTEVIRHVRFSRLEDFLEELRLQKATLSLPYVRFTGLWRRDRELPVIQHLTAVAGFWGAKEFVELRVYCGQVVGDDLGETETRFQKLRADLLAALAELNAPVRWGAWTQGKEL